MDDKMKNINLRTVFVPYFFVIVTVIVTVTEDGSTDVVPPNLYGPYLILGVFGSCMF